jgi:hypothetical protein
MDPLVEEAVAVGMAVRKDRVEHKLAVVGQKDPGAVVEVAVQRHPAARKPAVASEHKDSTGAGTPPQHRHLDPDTQAAMEAVHKDSSYPEQVVVAVEDQQKVEVA